MTGAQQAARRGRTSDAGNATEKALRLLEAVAALDRPQRLSEIAVAAAVPKASTHRILQTLVANRFLSSDGVGGYGPGPRLRTLAARLTAGQVAGGVEETLRELQRMTGQTVHLALRGGDSVTYTHKVEGTEALQMVSRVGMQMALHSTAIGKCILADLEPSELDDFVMRSGLPARTEATLSTRDSLLGALEAVRRDGFAIDDEENEPRIRCLAAPVRDVSGAVIGGVSVSTVAFLVPRDQLLDWETAVRDAASVVSKRLA